MTKKQIAFEIIAKHEGFRSKPYLDTAGVPTIGKGTTIYPDGTRVTTKDKPCTEAQADAWLQYHLDKRVFPIVDKYDVVVPSNYLGSTASSNSNFLPDKVYISLCSFVYNLGSIGGSVKRELEKKPLDLKALGEAMKLYNKEKIDGKFVVNTGLDNRRKEEVKYFMEA